MSNIKDEKKLIQKFFVPILLGKLRGNRHKTHWENETIDNLLKRVDEEIKELKAVVKRNHKSKVAFEAADVALYCAMIAYLSTMPESKNKKQK